MKGFVTPEKTKYHAEILANRIRKRFHHLSRRFKREGIECFRLYDWDIKEVRAVVDWYAGHVVIGEYVRLQTGPDWLPRMAAAVAAALELPPNRVHEEIKSADCEVLKHLANLPELKDDWNDEKKLVVIEKVYKELSDPAHPVSIAMAKMQDVPEVRIIEGVEADEREGEGKK